MEFQAVFYAKARAKFFFLLNWVPVLQVQFLVPMKQECREELVVDGLLVECLVDGSRIWRVHPDPVSWAAPAVLSPNSIEKMLA